VALGARWPRVAAPMALADDVRAITVEPGGLARLAGAVAETDEALAIVRALAADHGHIKPSRPGSPRRCGGPVYCQACLAWLVLPMIEDRARALAGLLIATEREIDA
jgi:hypothetical protein